jgi:peptidoglycan/LPS O-acetylase OafA/YrhL
MRELGDAHSGTSVFMSRSVPLQSIQILRAVAATLVVVGHSLHDSAYIAEHTGRAAIEWPYIEWGFGVDIFFVISGFIMIYTTADLFGKPGAASTFLQRRFIRIATLYWLMTTLLLVVALVAPRFLNVPIENWRAVVASYLFIPDLRGNGEVRPILAGGWTLNYEMFFYTIFACGLTLPLRRGVIWVCVFFVSLSGLGAMVSLPGVALPFWANAITLEFVFGVLIGLACRAGWTISAGRALTLAAIGIGLTVLFSPAWGLRDSVPQFLYAGVPAALLVLAAALGPVLQPTRIVLFLVAIGDASYSLYLTHAFVLRPLRNVWIAVHGGALPLILYVIVCIAVAIVAAFVIYQTIELPLTATMQRWLLGKGKSRERATAPQPATARVRAP